MLSLTAIPPVQLTAMRTGYTSVPVCEFLNGTKWSEVALCYLSGFKPSGIRVTTGECTTDYILGRITVAVDSEDTIISMEMEVQVDLPYFVEDGCDLKRQAFAKMLLRDTRK